MNNPMTTTRRGFLKLAGLCAGAAAVRLWTRPALAGAAQKNGVRIELAGAADAAAGGEGGEGGGRKKRKNAK